MSRVRKTPTYRGVIVRRWGKSPYWDREPHVDVRVEGFPSKPDLQFSTPERTAIVGQTMLGLTMGSRKFNIQIVGEELDGPKSNKEAVNG